MDFIVFEGTLKDLCKKVDKNELIPKLQASHAPPCKFWTAYAVINGIKHCVPLIHGPTGCTYSVASAYKMNACNYRGCPFEPTSCTALNELCIVFGGEGKLYEAAKEAKKKFNPDLIVILSCCCSGIIGDDVETVAQRVEKEINTKVPNIVDKIIDKALEKDLDKRYQKASHMAQHLKKVITKIDEIKSQRETKNGN